MNNMSLLNASIAQTLDYAAPILFAALGGLMSENAGVVNIALEGMMRFAAFFGVWGAFISGSPWLDYSGVSELVFYLVFFMLISL